MPRHCESSQEGKFSHRFLASCGQHLSEQVTHTDPSELRVLEVNQIQYIPLEAQFFN